MCGLAGFVEFDRDPEARPDRLEMLSAMGRQLARRGPDDERRYDDKHLSLVFRRLSIVDVAGGRQPIWNEDESLLIAVNGEIYNHEELRQGLEGRHRFRSRSDSEAVLHLYEDHGLDAFARLNGIFALALWDLRRERLVLARDRMGVKPLFYAQTPTGLLFGSEQKALLVHPQCPRHFRWNSLWDTYRAAEFARSGTETNVHGIESLPGGTLMVLDRGAEPSVKTYWSLADHFAPEGAEALPRASYVDRYATLIEDSVRGQLMSDVPVGIFLSGGLDSSLVAALAARAGARLHCFTVIEPSVEESGDAAAARKLAHGLGHPLHQVVFDPSAEAQKFSLEALEYYVWMADSPVFDMEFILKHDLHRFVKTVRPDLKVILLGQGADEFAGGYSNAYDDPRPNFAAYEMALRADNAEQLVGKRFAGLLSDTFPRDDHPRAARTPFQETMWRATFSLQRYNLWHEDRTSSGQSIEARVPFLDHRLVEHQAAIPTQLHSDLFWDKRIAREAAARFLGDELAFRHKVGFYMNPQMGPHWEQLGAMIDATLPEFCARYARGEDAIFSPSALRACYAKARATPELRGAAYPTILTCMTVAIFHRMCRLLPGGYLPAMLDPPSPLQSRSHDMEPSRRTRDE